MQTNFFDTFYPPVKLDTKDSILKMIERSGYSKVKSADSVLHHYRKENEDFGFIILRKTRSGYFMKLRMETHFVNNENMRAFSKDKHHTVFVIVIEKSTGITLIACLAKLIGFSGYNRGIPGKYFDRDQFLYLDSVVCNETRSLECSLFEIYENGRSAAD